MASNLQPPFVGPGPPDYPVRQEVVRLSSLSQKINVYSLYSAFLQQWDNRTQKLRDRISCLWFEANKLTAQPGSYMLGRLVASYQGMPLYAGSCGCGLAISSASSSSSSARPASKCCPGGVPLPNVLHATLSNVNPLATCACLSGLVVTLNFTVGAPTPTSFCDLAISGSDGYYWFGSVLVCGSSSPLTIALFCSQATGWTICNNWCAAAGGPTGGPVTSFTCSPPNFFFPGSGWTNLGAGSCGTCTAGGVFTGLTFDITITS